MEGVLKLLVEPYREVDRKEVAKCLKAQGGLDKCHLTFYESGDLGKDTVWDNWRLEGPAFVWHFRGAPHVHVWVNVASDPSFKNYDSRLDSASLPPGVPMRRASRGRNLPLSLVPGMNVNRATARCGLPFLIDFFRKAATVSESRLGRHERSSQINSPAWSETLKDRLALNQVTTLRRPLDEDVAACRQVGIPGIGLWWPKVAEFGDERTEHLLADTQLSVTSLSWAGGFTGLHGYSFDDSIEDARAALRLAGRLKARSLCICSGPRLMHLKGYARQLLIDALNELAADAGQSTCRPGDPADAPHVRGLDVSAFPGRRPGHCPRVPPFAGETGCGRSISSSGATTSCSACLSAFRTFPSCNCRMRGVRREPAMSGFFPAKVCSRWTGSSTRCLRTVTQARSRSPSGLSNSGRCVTPTRSIRGPTRSANCGANSRPLDLLRGKLPLCSS